MNKKTSSTMLVLLGVLIFIYHFGIGIYRADGLEPLPAFEFLYGAAFVCGVVWWLRAESRTFALSPVYCLGLLSSIGWIVLSKEHEQ